MEILWRKTLRICIHKILPGALEQDTEYVCKKLGFTRQEFADYLKRAPVSHFAYPSYAKTAKKLVAIYKGRRYRR